MECSFLLAISRRLVRLRQFRVDSTSMVGQPRPGDVFAQIDRARRARFVGAREHDELLARDRVEEVLHDLDERRDDPRHVRVVVRVPMVVAWSGDLVAPSVLYEVGGAQARVPVGNAMAPWPNVNTKL